MNTGLEQTIVERLHVLNDTKLAEVLDFMKFLVQSRTVVTKQPVTIGRARGAMKGMLSTVDEFIAHKEREKFLECQ